VAVPGVTEAPLESVAAGPGARGEHASMVPNSDTHSRSIPTTLPR
jgi:hypothetical protein